VPSHHTSASHYQRALGESADLIGIGGDDPDDVFFVAGAKILY
jgi:hypothetical protein